jgi:hypothetical protein
MLRDFILSIGYWPLPWLLAVFFLSTTGRSDAAPGPDYLKTIKPILAARCYSCHGALQQKAGLRVDTAAAIRESGIIVPGKSKESSLMMHISGEAGYERMPPPSEGEALTGEQRQLLEQWIDAGAHGPATEEPDPDPREHWAFRAPVRPQVPQQPGSSAAINPIDAFLAQKRAEHHLTPTRPAEPRLLLRRVYLDLIGIPPTEAEMTAFLADAAPDAYEKVVDRLLASPQYGERWGRHFMDIWRYSDWWGLGDQVRNSQKHIWHWRDWIIESLNNDLGYDEMLRLMLAADELRPNDLQALRATGFLARQYFLFNRTTWLDGLLEHSGKAFLGLTINCAKCHDHKYDPISQTDYYRLRAFFEPYQIRHEMLPGEPNIEKNAIPRAYDCNLNEPTYKHFRGDDRQPLKGNVIAPGLPGLLAFRELSIQEVVLPREAHSPHLRQHVIQNYLAAAMPRGELAVRAVRARATADRLKLDGSPEQFLQAARSAAKLEKELALADAEATLQRAEAELNAAPEAKRADALKKRDAAKAAVDAAQKALGNPGEKYTPLRGAIKSQQDPTEPIAAAQAATFPKISTGRRTAFANWLTDRQNPLTARVLVNHLWLRHFGQPLVATIFDFGRKGAKPTHPELLDWLAVEFMDHGWSMKHLHRLMVTSQTYRLASTNAGAEEQHRRDPENRWLWRQNPQRLDAQAIRDSLLHLAGLLDLTPGGPSIPLSQQDTSRRRSLYFVHSHNDHHKFLSQFDDANVLECYRRDVSIVPQQALTLANSGFALQMAEAITRQLESSGSSPASDSDDQAFITRVFRLLLACDPTEAERSACSAALAEWRTLLAAQKHPHPASKARLNLVAAILNHNDFITVR